MGHIYLLLKSFASYIDVEEECILLYPRRRKDGIIVTITDFSKISFQLNANKMTKNIKDEFTIEICNFARLGHAMQIWINYDNIKSILKERPTNNEQRKWKLLYGTPPFFMDNVEL